MHSADPYRRGDGVATRRCQQGKAWRSSTGRQARTQALALKAVGMLGSSRSSPVRQARFLRALAKGWRAGARGASGSAVAGADIVVAATNSASRW